LDRLVKQLAEAYSNVVLPAALTAVMLLSRGTNSPKLLLKK